MEDRPTAPLVPLMLDRERHLRLTLAALARYKKQIGKPLFSLFDEIGKLADDPKAATDIPETEIATAIWAMAVHEDPALTVEQVMEEVDFRNLDVVIGKITEAIGGEKAAATVKRVNGQDPLAAPATLIGSASGASPATTSESELPSSTN